MKVAAHWLEGRQKIVNGFGKWKRRTLRDVTVFDGVTFVLDAGGRDLQIIAQANARAPYDRTKIVPVGLALFRLSSGRQLVVGWRWLRTIEPYTH